MTSLHSTSEIDRLNMDPFCRDIINPSGIYAAIDTYDMGKVIQEGLKAITRKSCVRSALSSSHYFKEFGGKSEEESREARILGNEFYKGGKMKHATQCYNKALALAPKFSKEMILAYSNRSAVFFYKRYIGACLKDINTCLSLGCTGSLAEKLKKRREDASPLLFQQYAFEMRSNDMFVNSYLRVNNHHTQVSCVRSDVSFETDGVKRVTAGVEIKVGSVVGFEKAFVVRPTELYIVCYYCNKPELCLDPCEGCDALFCSEECRERCMKEYHCIECQLAELIGKENNKVQLAIQAAIKMSLRVTWDDFVAASKDMGTSKMKTDTVKQAFSPDEPLALLSYIENEPFMEGKMYNGSILIAGIILRLLQKSKHYFPKEKDKREAAVVALGRVMLQLFVTFTNGIEIHSSAYNIDCKAFEGGVQSSYGWFSMSSKLKHSCEPNLLVLGLNDSIALIALKTIKPGEELTICYDGVFYDRTIYFDNSIHRRMNHLFLKARKICDECRVCSQNWNRNVVAVKMTKKQAKLFEKLTKSPRTMDYRHVQTIGDVLDAFSYNSEQHLIAYEHLRGLLNIIQCKFFINYTFS